MAYVFRRSATYMNKLSAISNAQFALKQVINIETHKRDLEMRRAEDLNLVYAYIERRARVGEFRICRWNTALKIEDELIFEDAEIKSYLMSNGFTYNGFIFEWRSSENTDEIK